MKRGSCFVFSFSKIEILLVLHLFNKYPMVQQNSRCTNYKRLKTLCCKFKRSMLLSNHKCNINK